MKVISNCTSQSGGNLAESDGEEFVNLVSELLGSLEIMVVGDVFMHDFPQALNGVEVRTVCRQVM